LGWISRRKDETILKALFLPQICDKPKPSAARLSWNQNRWVANPNRVKLLP